MQKTFIINTKIQNVHAIILDCTRSKNYDAFNVLAIIDNKLVSWFNKNMVKGYLCQGHLRCFQFYEFEVEYESYSFSSSRLVYYKVFYDSDFYNGF